MSTEYEMSGYAIALQRAIEAHCRGEVVDETETGGCPWHAKKLNAMTRKCVPVSDAVVDAAYEAFFADYKARPSEQWKEYLRTALKAVWPLTANAALTGHGRGD